MPYIVSMYRTTGMKLSPIVTVRGGFSEYLEDSPKRQNARPVFFSMSMCLRILELEMMKYYENYTNLKITNQLYKHMTDLMLWVEWFRELNRCT